MKLPQTFKGKVVKGYGRGHSTLGFPTANISSEKWSVEILESEYGVYCGLVYLESELVKFGVISIGRNLTFNEIKPTFEVHILDFDKDIYNQICEIKLTHFLRPMISFKTIKDLISQIKLDLDQSISLLKELKE